MGVGDLRGEVIEEFLRERQRYAEFGSCQALEPLLDHFAQLGLLPVPMPAVLDPVGEVLDAYSNRGICWASGD